MSKLYDSAISAYSRFDTGTQDFKEYHRHIEIAITNGVKYQLHYEDDHFDSGTFFEHPKPIDIEPGTASILYVTNKAGSVLTGVSGGLDYKIKGSTGDQHLYIGFSNPQTGSYKTFVSVGTGKSAEWAYDQLDNADFKRVTENGFGVTAAIRPAKRGEYRTFDIVIVEEEDKLV